MKKNNPISTITIIMGLLILSVADSALAGWQGPTQVVSGPFGKSTGQFGIEESDSGEVFPASIGVTDSGHVVIADSINGVLHTFDSNGRFIRDIIKPTPRELWPYSVIVNGNCAAVGYVDYTHTFNVVIGEIVGIANNMGGVDYISNDCESLYVGEKPWKIYSPSGQLYLAT